jgi:hypothetical protein
MGMTMFQVLDRMTAMGVSHLEAHWLLGRLAVDVPNALAEALEALERKRAEDAEATAHGRAVA